MTTIDTIRIILSAIQYLFHIVFKNEMVEDFTKEMGNGLMLTNTEIV